MDELCSQLTSLQHNDSHARSNPARCLAASYIVLHPFAVQHGGVEAMSELLTLCTSAATLATAPGECGRKMLLLLVLPCRPTSLSMSAPSVCAQLSGLPGAIIHDNYRGFCLDMNAADGRKGSR